MSAANDNTSSPPAQPGRLVPIVGFVAGDGVVTITDPTWRPSRPSDVQALFPNDVREA